MKTGDSELFPATTDQQAEQSAIYESGMTVAGMAREGLIVTSSEQAIWEPYDFNEDPDMWRMQCCGADYDCVCD